MMRWTDDSRALLRAVMDCVIPADDFPSASQAGVGEYIERILDERDMAQQAVSFQRGLDGVAAESQARFGRSFVSLSLEEQDQLLTSLESGEAQAQWQTPAPAFFRLLVDLCGEGYYADPGNGGNREMAGWKMIGWDPKGQTP